MIEWLYMYYAETTAERDEVLSSHVCLLPNKSFMAV